MPAERTIIKLVVDNLNKSKNIVGNTGIEFVVHYLDVVFSIDEVIKIQKGQELDDSSDVFIGIFWHRMGPISLSVSTDSETDSTEYIRHCERLIQHGILDILLYRCLRPARELSAISASQLNQVNRLFSDVDILSRFPIEYKTYFDLEEFQQNFTADLIRIFRRYQVNRLQGESSGYSKQELFLSLNRSPGDAIEEALRGLESCSLSILHVNIINRKEIFEKLEHTTAKTLLVHLDIFLLKSVFQYGGDSIKEFFGERLFAFWGSDKSDRAIRAASQIIKELPKFNGSRELNPQALPIEIRIAATNCSVGIQSKEEDRFILGDSLSDLIRASETTVNSGELCVSDRLFGELGKDIGRRFSFRGTNEGQVLHVLRDKRATQSGFTGDFPGQILKIFNMLSFIRNVLSFDQNERSIRFVNIEDISRMIDKIYSAFSYLQQNLSMLSSSDTAIEHQQIVKYVTQTKDVELVVWNSVRKIFSGTSDYPDIHTSLAAILSATGSRRLIFTKRTNQLLESFDADQIIAQKNKLEIFSHDHGSVSAESKKRSDENKIIVKCIDELLDSDELDEAEAVTNFLNLDVDHTHRYLQNKSNRYVREELGNKLWSLASILLLNNKHPDDTNCYNDYFDHVLSFIDETSVRSRFELIQGFLKEPTERCVEFFSGKRRIAYQDYRSLSRDDRNVLFRCVLVAYPENRLREIAAEQLDEKDLWKSIAHERTPLDTLLAVAQVSSIKNRPQKMKVFFDCIRQRLQTAIESEASDSTTSIRAIRMLLTLFFNLDFFVETAYFERLDDLYRLAITNAVFSESSDFLEAMRSSLASRRLELGEPDTKLPEKLMDYPLPIQRRLAGEVLHFREFIACEDPRIALATINHFTTENIENLLLPYINRQLFRALLHRPGLFARRSVVLKALHHRHCDVSIEFVKTKSMWLTSQPGGKQDLKMLLNSPDVRKAVKDTIWLFLKQLEFHG
ncbi:MAG: hypothetical protein H6965_13555 [Chromatiaceae bacterium]|nr:hypothetical protein [Chromatiaceae bacterium]